MQPLLPGFPLVPAPGGGLPGMPGLGLGAARPQGPGLPVPGFPLGLAGALGFGGGLGGALPGLALPPGIGAPGVAALQASLLAQAQARQASLLGIRPLAKGMLAPGALAPKSLAVSTSKSNGPPGPPALLSKAPPAVCAPSPAPCTVYVGRISTEVSDDFVKQMLERCGKVTKWNRASDPNTSKLTSFGFCEFEEPEAVWRALCFLHDKQLCDKRLLVKCEEVSTQNIRKWKEGRREDLEKKREQRQLEAAANNDGQNDKNGEIGPEKTSEAGCDGNQDKDDKGDCIEPKEQTNKSEVAKAEKLDEKTDENNEPALANESTNGPGVPLCDEEIELELLKESQDIANDIGKMLLGKNKGFPEVKVESSADDKDLEMPPLPIEEKKDDREKESDMKRDGADKENDKSKENDKNREGSRDRKRARSDDKKKHLLSRHYRQSRRERDREQRVRDRDRDIEKEYQYRIREFERAEESRRKRFKRDLQDLELPGEPSEREKRKFVERDLNFGDQADEQEWKRYREDRREHRLREREKDLADREAEQRENDAEERKGREEERRRRRQEEEDRQRKDDEERKLRKAEEELRRQEQLALEEEKRLALEEERRAQLLEQKKQEEQAAAKLLMSIQQDMQSMEQAAQGSGAVSTLFRDADEAQGQGTRSAPRAGDVKLRDDEMRRLIQQVPTDKASAFAFEIDWVAVSDHQIIEKKLRPWVKKKVTEYLGAEEQGMIEFIMRKVASQTRPDSILAELEGFLDEEAENFTLKMWRMLIFEVLRVKAR